jgi:serine/threonine-protein kinase
MSSFNPSADRNLLLGILALQMDFVSRDALVAAMHAWVLRKSTSLGQLLLEQGALRADTHALLEAIVEKHLEMHGGDAHKSLAAVSSIRSLRNDLEQIADPDLCDSLAQVSVARQEEEVPATRYPCGGWDEEVDAPATRPPSNATPMSSGVRLRTVDGRSNGAGRNLLYEEIGRGGMGVILRGRDPDLGRDLAVKLLLPKHSGDEGLERRFVEEAQIAGQLQHPGVVPIYELGRFADQRPYFTMKLIKGRTLAELLAERSDPSHDLPRYLGIFEHVCQALAYAHSKGVIHRDLKPANIMVGAFGEVQVMDWGLAKVLQSREPDDPEHTTAGTLIRTVRSGSTAEEEGYTGVVGTPAFMAPEQARGEMDQVDERADVFGLGAILCVILTGEPPYRGGSMEEVQARAARGNLGDAVARLEGSGADRELVQLARACLAAALEGRLRNAEEVSRAVGAYLAGVQERLHEAERQRAAAEARAEEAGARARAERRARRLLVWLAAVGLMVVVGGGVIAWMAREQRTRQSQAAQDVLSVLAREPARLKEAWEEQDLGKLAAVKAAADRAVDIARSGAAGATLQEQAAAFKAEAEERLERAQKNRELRDAVLDVSAPGETFAYLGDGLSEVKVVAQKSVDDQYTDAFKRWGLDIDSTAEADALRRLRQEPELVVQDLVAALDAWMLERRRQKYPEARWRRLFGLAERLDRSPRRQELRALLVGETLPHAASVAGLLGTALPWPAFWELGRGDQCRRLQELRGKVTPATEPVLTILLLAQTSSALGDFTGAEQALRQALAERPTQVVLLEALGRLLERQQRPQLEEAIGCYRAVRALRPGLGLALCRALEKADRGEEGEAVLRALVRQQRHNPAFWTALGNILDKQKKLDEAVAAFRQAIRLKPDYSSAYANLGGVLLGQRKLLEAEAACRKAIELAPDLAVAHLNLGLALRFQGKRRAAVAACRKAAALAPDDPDTHLNLGLALAAVGKPADAVRAYRRALELAADTARLYNNLGVALDADYKREESAAAFHKAIELDPKLVEAHGNLGIYLFQQAQFREAIASLKRAEELLPATDGRRGYVRGLVRVCERQLIFEGRLAAVLAGKDKPGTSELIEFANLCRRKKLSAAAACFYREAFKANPRSAESLSSLARYNAACTAALAAAGQSKDAAGLSDRERADLRHQALAWLRADLKAWVAEVDRGNALTRINVELRLGRWQTDSDLASVRDKDPLDKLPEAERKSWQTLWADVDRLRKRVGAEE